MSEQIEVTNEMCAAGIAAWNDTLGTAYTRYAAVYRAMQALAPEEVRPSITPTEGRKQLADLAFLRFRTAVEQEGKSEAAAFQEVIVGLLEAQDETWGKGRALQ